MKIIEHNDESRGETIDGLDPYYGEYDEILDILDFPLESLGDDNLMDWDASNSQDLGPIPLDAFMGFYQTSIGNEYVNKVPRRDHNALISIESEQKAHADLVVEDFNAIRRSGSDTSRRIVISPETSAFQTSSPISVLESSGTCSSDKSLPISFEAIIPVRARSKRGRPSSTNQWFTKTPITGAGSVVKKRSNSIKAKKRPRTYELANDLKGLQENLNHTEKKATSMQRFFGTRSCTHCNVTKTPQWREGPLGKNTLCNACGVRYRTGRLFPEYRPAASPTFTPSLHSNLHKEVINRRKNAIHEAVQVENPTSSQGQFVPITQR